MSLQGILKGSAAFKDAIEKGPKGGSRFLKLGDGESVTLRFMQEIDESGKNFTEDRGLAVGFYEHVNPDDYKKSFRCTAETLGRCAGCERIPVNSKWRAKGRLIVNVLVRSKDGADEVKIFSASLSQKGLAPQIIDYANDYGSLCDRDYKLTRRGSGMQDTVYTLLPRDTSPLKAEDKSAELHDLDEVVRNLTYEEQLELLDGSGGDNW
jgi:hypothetical protein